MNRRALLHRKSWVVVALVASHAAFAGDDQRTPGVAVLPKYKQECAACHVAFPPGMLPAESWRRLLSNLPHHYGTDASLDAATVNELATWLSANAGTYRRVREAPLEDRITRSAWFIRKHDEVPAAVWKRPAVKSATNCAACHTQADQGDFNEHTVRIPR
jgi:mono/diheme cytochrome c family protein